jgi:uncharacterized cupredoxin-like copper-binding protein
MFRRSLLSLGALVALAGTVGAQGRTVVVTASDFTFSLPDSIPAGLTTFELVNRGPELHHMQVIRLDQGKTFADFEAAMKSHGPPPAWASFVGGPNAGIPDGRSTVTVTATLKPGAYVLLCMIPSPDGKPHVMKGMVRPLTVTGGSAAVVQAGMPKADVVMTLYDYNFDVDKPLTAGKRVIEIKNSSKQFHEAFLAMLPANTPVTAMLDWMSGGMQGPPPMVPVGGIVGISPGEVNFLTVDLQPGNYGLYCFLPAPDGKEHVAHGMFKQITVTK